MGRRRGWQRAREKQGVGGRERNGSTDRQREKEREGKETKVGVTVRVREKEGKKGKYMRRKVEG